MKYLITFKDCDAYAQRGGAGGHMAYQQATSGPSDDIVTLPVPAREWFPDDEYVTLEWDSDTKQMRVVHPTELPGEVQIPIGRELYVKRQQFRSGSFRDHEGGVRTYTVSLYSDGKHTCECPAWYYRAGNTGFNRECKHIHAVLHDYQIDIRVRNFENWELRKDDDRQRFEEDQTRFYVGE